MPLQTVRASCGSADLFGHVSREVPRMTRGRQHPHGDFRGTNLPLIVIGESVQPQDLQSLPQSESVTEMTTQKPTVHPGGGGKKWIWALLGVALVGGAAAGVTLGGGFRSRFDPATSRPPKSQLQLFCEQASGFIRGAARRSDAPLRPLGDLHRHLEVLPGLFRGGSPHRVGNR